MLLKLCPNERLQWRFRVAERGVRFMCPGNLLAPKPELLLESGRFSESASLIEDRRGQKSHGLVSKNPKKISSFI